MAHKHRVGVKWTQGHYVITVDGQFYCSCDNWKEVCEEIESIQED